MSEIRDALMGCADQQEPTTIGPGGFRLACRLGAPASDDEIASGPPSPPTSLHELWRVTREADLFVDVDYGQWGLRLLSPAASAARTSVERCQRPDDFDEGDVVIGEFLGDQDLLVLDAAGRPLIALPLDDRDDWDRPAGDLATFLRRYVAGKGEKFWT